MSKILKITAKRESLIGVTKYIYPPEYDAQKITIICHEEAAECLTRDNDDQIFIGIVDDADAAQFLLSSDIEEMNEASAIIDGSRWRPQITKVTDVDKALAIVAKQALGGTLTQLERDALDPTNPEPGIGKTQSFTDILSQYTITE